MHSKQHPRGRAQGWLLWLVLLAGCSTLLGVEDSRVQGACSSNAECAPEYDCLQGSCRNHCGSDAECGPGARCLKAIGTSACIPSAESCGESCPEGASCVGDVCRTQCGSVEDCAGGQECQQGVCVGTDPTHDAPDSGGTGGAATGGAGSGAGTGGGEPHEGGAAGMAGAAALVSCTPDQPSCLGNVAVVCNGEGDGYVGAGQACAAEESCVAGVCEEHECTPSEVFCSGNALRECAADGLSSLEVQACTSSQYCDDESASCQDGICAPDKPACDGERATVCNAGGSGYLPGGTTCGTGTSCEGGSCAVHLCAPSSTFCQGQDVKTCSANGLISEVQATCAQQTCVKTGAAAACQGVCAPGESICAANKTSVLGCDTKGQYTLPTACTNKTCVPSGRTATCVGECAPGQVRCDDEGTGVQTCGADGHFGTAVPCGASLPACSAGECVAAATTCSVTGGVGSGAATFSTTSDWKAVTRDGHNYIVQNNVLGAEPTQKMTVAGVSFTVTEQTDDNTGTGTPTSYPSVFIGSNHGRSTANSKLPKQLSALTTLPTAWSWSGANGLHNATYDLWFSTSAAGDAGSPSGGYLMIWLNEMRGIVPIGSNNGMAVVSGTSYQFWIGSQLGKPVITYVPSLTTTSRAFDLKPFITHAVASGVLPSTWYLTNIFAGFEIFSGGVGLKTNNFCAIVN